jgi:hypothetical protein
VTESTRSPNTQPAGTAPIAAVCLLGCITVRRIITLALLVEALVAYCERSRVGFVPKNLQDDAQGCIIHTKNLYPWRLP